MRKDYPFYVYYLMEYVKGERKGQCEMGKIGFFDDSEAQDWIVWVKTSKTFDYQIICADIISLND